MALNFIHTHRWNAPMAQNLCIGVDKGAHLLDRRVLNGAFG